MIHFGQPPAPSLGTARPVVELDRALRQGLPLGARTHVQGSARDPYVITHHTDGNWSCTCPAWRMQRASADVRTCKHVNLVRKTSAAPSISSPAPRIAPPKLRLVTGPDPLDGGVLLAQTWDGTRDLTGWLGSEKLNGVRGIWSQHHLWSREGNPFSAPRWFTQGFPTEMLDGELYMGRGKGWLQRTVSIVSKDVPRDDEWTLVRFHVFDLPQHPGPFRVRYAALKALVASLPASVRLHLVLVPHAPIQSPGQLTRDFRTIKDGGGEGMMARDPDSAYAHHRSTTLLKIIERQHAEVRILGTVEGTGKNKGRVGSYEVAFLDTGVRFKVGSGIPEAQRDHPLPVGTVLTISFAERTLDGKAFQPAYEVTHGASRRT